MIARRVIIDGVEYVPVSENPNAKRLRDVLELFGKVDTDHRYHRGEATALDMAVCIASLRATARQVTDVQPQAKPTVSRRPHFDPLSVNIPACLDSEEFRLAWRDFVGMRREIKKPLVETSAKTLLRKLESWGAQKAVCALRASTENQWQGVFDQDEKRRNGSYNAADPRGTFAAMDAFLSRDRGDVIDAETI